MYPLAFNLAACTRPSARDTNTIRAVQTDSPFLTSGRLLVNNGADELIATTATTTTVLPDAADEPFPARLLRNQYCYLLPLPAQTEHNQRKKKWKKKFSASPFGLSLAIISVLHLHLNPGSETTRSHLSTMSLAFVLSLPASQ